MWQKNSLRKAGCNLKLLRFQDGTAIVYTLSLCELWTLCVTDSPYLILQIFDMFQCSLGHCPRHFEVNFTLNFNGAKGKCQCLREKNQ